MTTANPLSPYFCAYVFKRHDGSQIRKAPFRVDDATASVKVDDLSNVKMCWMEYAVPGMQTEHDVASFLAAVVLATTIFALALV